MAWKQCSQINGVRSICTFPRKAPRMGYYADRVPGKFIVIAYASVPYCDRELMPKSMTSINACYQKANSLEITIIPSTCPRKALFGSDSPCGFRCSRERNICLRVYNAMQCRYFFGYSTLQKQVRSYGLCSEEAGLDGTESSRIARATGMQATSRDQCEHL